MYMSWSPGDEEERNYKWGWGNMWGWWIPSLSRSHCGPHEYTPIWKLIKLNTLNICNLLYFTYTSIKLRQQLGCLWSINLETSPWCSLPQLTGQEAEVGRSGDYLCPWSLSPPVWVSSDQSILPPCTILCRLESISKPASLSQEVLRAAPFTIWLGCPAVDMLVLTSLHTSHAGAYWRASKSSWAAQGPSFGLHPRSVHKIPWPLWGRKATTSWTTACLSGLWGGGGSAFVMSPQGCSSCERADAVPDTGLQPIPRPLLRSFPGPVSSVVRSRRALLQVHPHSCGHLQPEPDMVGESASAKWGGGQGQVSAQEGELQGYRGKISKPNVVGRGAKARGTVWAHARQEIPGSLGSIRSHFLRMEELGVSETTGTARAGRPKWGAEGLGGDGSQAWGLPQVT